MAKPVLLKNLSKRYSSHGNPKESLLVLEEINLELNEGELLTMVGPKGCGKSTILKMIAGLEHPTGGEIYVDGHRVEDVPAKDRNVGFLVPGNPLFEHMTVADNISLGFNFRKILSRDRRRSFEQLVTLMGLEEVLDQSPRQISKMQQHRVALAILLAPQPRVVLLDDPFSGLDTAARQRLRVDTKLWQRELNIPTILATHDRIEALEMGDRIAILNDGRFQQIDTSRNLLNNPANAFVAHFIGSENGYLSASDKGTCPATGTAEADLPSQAETIVRLPDNGQQRVEDGPVESAVASTTFLGRPIRLEVDHNDGLPTT